MGYLDTRTETAEPEATRRPLSSRLADLGDRIARALPPPRREPEYTFPVHSEAEAEANFPTEADLDPYRTEEFKVRRVERAPVDDILPRFPVTRQGYDCDAVDQHITALEDELDELERQLDEARAQLPSRDAVAIEIERVGEQTSAILVAAHDEARETVRRARSQADTMIADATSQAAATTQEATARVQELERRAESLDSEHERRLGELRSTAAALQSLADDAAHRLAAGHGAAADDAAHRSAAGHGVAADDAADRFAAGHGVAADD